MPNPVPGRAVPRAAAARLEMVDVTGRRVASRDVGGLGAGTHRVDLSAGAGVYFLRLVQGADVAVRRIVVLDSPPERACMGGGYPPAIAPTTSRGSSPEAMAAGSGTSGDSLDQSSWQA